MIFMNINKPVFVAAASLFFCGFAFGQVTGAGVQPAMDTPDGKSIDVFFFGGLRVWNTTWDEPVLTLAVVNPTNPNNPSAGGVTLVEQRYSSTRVAPIPFLGVRYGNIIASASYLARTAYSFSGLPSDVRRDELDLTLGYYVLPQLALSVGYKVAKVDRISALAEGGSKTGAIFIGASGSVPLEGIDRLSLYGNFAYGLGSTKPDASLGLDKVDNSYKIGEIGLSYRLLSAPLGALKQLNLSLGYRAQIVTLKDVPFGTYSTPGSLTPTSVERRDIQTTTDGVVIGLIGVF